MTGLDSGPALSAYGPQYVGFEIPQIDSKHMFREQHRIADDFAYESLLLCRQFVTIFVFIGDWSYRFEELNQR